MKGVICLKNLDVIKFDIITEKDFCVITQFFPLGKWSPNPCFVMILSTGDSNMLVLTFNSSKVCNMIIDGLDKIKRKAFLDKGNIQSCIVE